MFGDTVVVSTAAACRLPDPIGTAWEMTVTHLATPLTLQTTLNKTHSCDGYEGYTKLNDSFMTETSGLQL